MPRIDPLKMPNCEMARVIVHWTAGAYTASAVDRAHYHILVQGDGTLAYGDQPISANAKPPRDPRANHTRNCNTGSIGVAVCAMRGAVERPFKAGPAPMTQQQWQVMAEVVAELCARYRIDVTPRTVLAHGEVEQVLKIKQLQKWDPLVQPWSPATPRTEAMAGFRTLVQTHLAQLTGLAAAPLPEAVAAAAAPAGAPAVATRAATPANFKLQTQDWPADSAVLLVHGVGNARQGDNDEVERAIRTAIGSDTAVYSLFYDVFNDWFREKTQFTKQLEKLLPFLKAKQESDSRLAETIAETAGDVVWPIFSDASRATVRTAYQAQLRQMILDGIRSTGERVPVRDLKLSIVCHSLGCFHTYEFLHEIASNPLLNLGPGKDGVRFRSVVFMASPVQLVRTVATGIPALVPSGLASAAPGGLSIPKQTAFGITTKSMTRCVSVTGDLDPIGGHFLRRKADWAYMHIDEPETIELIDRQTLIGTGDEELNLLTILRAARSDFRPPELTLNNPHSWLGYVQRHTGDLPTWFS